MLAKLWLWLYFHLTPTGRLLKRNRAIEEAELEVTELLLKAQHERNLRAIHHAQEIDKTCTLEGRRPTQEELVSIRSME